MEEEISKIISKIKTELHKELERYHKRENLTSLHLSKLLVRLFFNLHELSKFGNINPRDYIGIEQLKNKITDELIQKASEHFFGWFYRVKSSLKNNDFQNLQQCLEMAICDVSTINIQILSGSHYAGGDSLSGAFFDRLKHLIECASKIINNKSDEKLSSFFKLAIISLCIVNRCLVDYSTFIKNGAYKDLVKEYTNQTQIALKKAFLDIEKTQDNLDLLCWTYLNIKDNSFILGEDISLINGEFEKIKKQIKENYQSIRDRNLIYLACNMFELKEELLFDEIYEFYQKKLLNDKPDHNYRPLFIRLLICKLKKSKINITIDLEIYPEVDALNTEEVMQKLFPDYYANNTNIVITPTDLEKLYKLNDLKLRKKLGQILQKSNNIAKFEKDKLLQESTKPHSGYETSDIEVKIKGNSTGADEDIIVHFVIKSGVEIKNSVSDKWMSQIIKPFTHYYGKCVVIFLTAKRCSQPLIKQINLFKTKNKYPIEILQDTNLCKILKFYQCLD